MPETNEETASPKRAGPQMTDEPKPPFAKQQQQPPGLESKLDPQPRYQAPNYKAAGKLKGKVALITGGDSGIGRAVAVLFAREGADVAINYLPEEQSDAVETQRVISAEGQRCVLLPGDLVDPKLCESIVAQTVKELGKLDILVSNAAHQARKQSVEEVTDDEFDLTFKTNIYAYYRLVRAAMPHLKPGR